MQQRANALQTVQYADPSSLTQNDLTTVKRLGRQFANSLRSQKGDSKNRGGLGQILSKFTGILENQISEDNPTIVEQYKKPTTAKRNYESAFNSVIDKMRLINEARYQQR